MYFIQSLSAAERMGNKSNHGEGSHGFSLEQLTTLTGNKSTGGPRGATCTSSQRQDQEGGRKQTLSRHVTEPTERTIELKRKYLDGGSSYR